MNSEPLFSVETLFTAGDDGYAKFRIPGVCVTPGGIALAHTEARRGRGGDWDDSDLLMRRSEDGGQTWGAASVLVRGADYGAGPVHNCNTLVDAEHGVLHVMFCTGYARAFHMVSHDDGANFSEPVEITETFERFRPEYDWGVLAVGLPNGIRLRSGRLLFPIWISISKTKAHRPNRCGVIYSDDEGCSWLRGALVPDVVPSLNECCALELEDGRVLLNMRNGAGVQRRVISVSADGGGEWATPWLDPALLEPTCQGTLFRYSSAAQGRSRVLFSNPHNVAGMDRKGSGNLRTRRNLSVKLSYDECRTWPVNRVIEPGHSGYSALAVSPDGTILCAFERGSPAGQDSDDLLALARFNLTWLGKGQDCG